MGNFVKCIRMYTNLFSFVYYDPPKEITQRLLTLIKVHITRMYTRQVLLNFYTVLLYNTLIKADCKRQCGKHALREQCLLCCSNIILKT